MTKAKAALAAARTWLAARYKAAVAATGSLVTWGLVVYLSPDPGVTRDEWGALMLLAATVLGVHGVSNQAP
jgi:hypothetical protein